MAIVAIAMQSHIILIVRERKIGFFNYKGTHLNKLLKGVLKVKIS